MEMADHNDNQDPNFRVEELNPDLVDEFSNGKVRLFLIRAKTDSDIGRQFENDPVGVLQERAPEMGITSDWKVSTVRVRAEIPANRVHKLSVWIVAPDQRQAAGMDYKFETAQD
jgi:hypothetical protein